MENEFVPYELALRLKALGFDEPCFGYYDNQRKEIDTISSDVCERLCKHDTHVKAPTFSQAFRWFREEQDMCGYVRRGSKTIHEHLKKEGFTVRDYEWSIATTEGISLNCRGMENSYEEAELECLEKLIKIVESKSK
jgi:hypothetical protein